jgi:hypothetical protein
MIASKYEFDEQRLFKALEQKRIAGNLGLN